MNGMIAIIDATEVPNATPLALPAEMIAWYAPGWGRYAARAAAKSAREWTASTPISTTNASSCRAIKLMMTRATSLTEAIESSATTTMTSRLIRKTAVSLVTEPAALASAAEWNAAPSPLSMNGVNWAAKCALVDRT